MSSGKLSSSFLVLGLHTSHTKRTASGERKGRLGPGWLPTYVPAVHRPWHSQHPSIIGNKNLLETCDRYESIFPNRNGPFEPKNMPWWTHCTFMRILES